MNTYIFPTNDTLKDTDANSPPLPTQCCEVCLGSHFSGYDTREEHQKVLYNDVGKTSEFTSCNTFYLAFVDTVGWVCTFASHHLSSPSTATVPAIQYYKPNKNA